MLQEVNIELVTTILELPDGKQRILDWITNLIEEKDTAQQVAIMCAKQVAPLKQRVQSLLEANTNLVLEMRELRSKGG